MKLELDATKHLLRGEAVSHKLKTPNTGGAFAQGRPDTLVVHYTAGSSGQSSAQWLCNPRAQASAHLVVDRSGKIWQLAPFNVVTWHAGRSSHLGRSGLNAYAIGIELDNLGPVTASSSGQFVSAFGQKLAPDDVLQATHRHHTHPMWWHRYTDVQLKATEQIGRLLFDAYGLKHLVGHEEISPGRKIDPGPAFPLEELRYLLQNRHRNLDAENSGRVVVDGLNIRGGPGTDHAPVAKPLAKGTLVDVENQLGEWLYVHVPSQKLRGWVHSRYVDLAD